MFSPGLLRYHVAFCVSGVLPGPTGVVTHPGGVMSHQSTNPYVCGWCWAAELNSSAGVCVH